MSVDDALLVGRIAFVAALYAFLLVLGLLLRRELRTRASLLDERAPCDLLVVDPHDTAFEAGERIPLLSQSTIGRGGDSDIVLDDSFVSAEHARLGWNGRGWVLVDLGSTNGTLLNGKQVKRATSVKPGDTIEFGRVKTKLVPV
ncbi:MAG TPA: FHA domain-containing protein [Chloroflexota bacterium]